MTIWTWPLVWILIMILHPEFIFWSIMVFLHTIWGIFLLKILSFLTKTWTICMFESIIWYTRNFLKIKYLKYFICQTQNGKCFFCHSLILSGKLKWLWLRYSGLQKCGNRGNQVPRQIIIWLDTMSQIGRYYFIKQICKLTVILFVRCRKTYNLILEKSISQNYFEKEQIIMFYLLAVKVTGRRFKRSRRRCSRNRFQWNICSLSLWNRLPSKTPPDT